MKLTISILLCLAASCFGQAISLSGKSTLSGNSTITVGTPAAWSPATETGLALWLDATTGVYTDDGSTPATDGQAVLRWNDNSASAWHVRQWASGPRPTYHTAVQNGNPSITFNGTSTHLTNNSISIANGSRTIFCVVTNAGGADQLVIDSQTGRFMFYVDYTGRFGWCDGTTFNDWSASTGWHTYILVLDAGGNTMKGYVDGTQQVADFTYSNGKALGVATAIGSRYDGSNFYFKGEMGEVGIYDHAIDATARANLQSYLKAKWGTP